MLEFQTLNDLVDFYVFECHCLLLAEGELEILVVVHQLLQLLLSHVELLLEEPFPKGGQVGFNIEQKTGEK